MHGTMRQEREICIGIDHVEQTDADQAENQSSRRGHCHLSMMMMGNDNS